MVASYLIVVVLFLLYYFLLVVFEKKFIEEPKEIIEKFLAFVLAYAGIALIYFSLTGKPLFSDSISDYSIYIFVIGFISILWAVPTLLSEFKFFRSFNKKGKARKR